MKLIKILTFTNFILRLIPYFLFSSLRSIFSLTIATVGLFYFVLISWIDVFFNASLTLIGLVSVNEISANSQKLLASVCALCIAFAFLGTIAVIFATVIQRLLNILHINEDEN